MIAAKSNATKQGRNTKLQHPMKWEQQQIMNKQQQTRRLLTYNIQGRRGEKELNYISLAKSPS